MSGLNVDRRNNHTNGAVEYVKSNRRWLRKLPDPGEEWTIRDLEIDIPTSRLKQIEGYGLITVVGELEIRPGSYRNVYSSRDKLPEILRKISTTKLLECSDEDCPSSGFRNPRGVEGVVCKDCGEVHESPGR